MDRTLTVAQARLWLEEPHNCTDAKDVLTIFTSLFDPLATLDPNMKYVPAAALSWDVSADARTWTFHLRSGLRFHDGEKLDAESVRHSLERMSRPDMGVTLGAPGVYHQYLAGMNLEILDEHTVRLTTVQPLADLLDVLTTGYILPPGSLQKLGEGFKDAPVGTGPYVFIEHLPGECIRAKKNSEYFHRLPDYDFIEWRNIPDPDQRIKMVSEGRAQIATRIPVEAVRPVHGVNYLQSRGTTTYIMIFNAHKGPLEDPRVRLALNLGVDRQAVIKEVLGGAGYPLHGFISPSHLGYDRDAPIFPYDPERARRLLKDAGHGGGLSLTLDSPTSMPDESSLLAKIVSEQLMRVGVEINTVYTEDRLEYANKVRLKDIHDMCISTPHP